MRRFVAAVALLLGAATACTGSPSLPGADLLVRGQADATPYRGPLYIPFDLYGRGPLHARDGAAGRALECHYRPYQGGSVDYSDGLTEVRSSFVEAVRGFLGPNNEPGTVPSSGYRIERRQGTRILLSFDVRGRTKVAIVVRNGMTDYLHQTGWGVETWAGCDPAEFPARTVEELGIALWTDEAGDPVPIGRVRSFPGEDVCEFPDTEYLTLGRPPAETGYARDPEQLMTKYLRVPFAGDARLPADAVDSGYRRDGRELWTVPGGAAVYLVSTSGTERWGAWNADFGCG